MLRKDSAVCFSERTLNDTIRIIILQLELLFLRQSGACEGVESIYDEKNSALVCQEEMSVSSKIVLRIITDMRNYIAAQDGNSVVFDY